MPESVKWDPWWEVLFLLPDRSSWEGTVIRHKNFHGRHCSNRGDKVFRRAAVKCKEKQGPVSWRANPSAQLNSSCQGFPWIITPIWSYGKKERLNSDQCVRFTTWKVGTSHKDCHREHGNKSLALAVFKILPFFISNPTYPAAMQFGELTLSQKVVSALS